MQKNTEFPPLPSFHAFQQEQQQRKPKDIYPEQITKFAFHLTRKTPYELEKLSKQFVYLLISIKNDLFITDEITEIKKYIDYFILLHKLIIYTRDIFVGKGERDLTYMMIYTLYTQFPILAIKILKTILLPNKYPYGSWKDIKYFCNYIKQYSHLKEEDPFIDTCIYIMNQQLIEDLSQLNNNNTKNPKISFVAKWIPREKKNKFGWLYHKCAIQWSQIIYPEYYYFNTTPTIKFQNKIKREYRKNISLLNRYLDTVQIKQCENKWSEINFNHVSITTLQLQWNVLLNQDKYGYIRKQQEDRNICRENIISYLFYKTNNNICKIPSSFQMEDLIKDIENAQTLEYMERINSNWDKVKSSILQNTENIIPILDLTTLNYRNALSISIMLSEISKLKNKVLLYDQLSSWVNLSDTNSLLEKIEKIQYIKQSKNNESSNLFSSLELLMFSIINTNISEEDVGNLVLCIISDYTTPINEMHLHIQYFFHKNGYKITPYIVYWNVSLHTNITYPSSAFTPRTLMISGTSSSCFQFINEPLWKEYTPYTYLCNILNQERYTEIEGLFSELINTE
jgi:hypothetical protein